MLRRMQGSTFSAMLGDMLEAVRWPQDAGLAPGSPFRASRQGKPESPSATRVRVPVGQIGTSTLAAHPTRQLLLTGLEHSVSHCIRQTTYCCTVSLSPSMSLMSCLCHAKLQHSYTHQSLCVLYIMWCCCTLCYHSTSPRCSFWLVLSSCLMCMCSENSSLKIMVLFVKCETGIRLLLSFSGMQGAQQERFTCVSLGRQRQKRGTALCQAIWTTQPLPPSPSSPPHPSPGTLRLESTSPTGVNHKR